MSENNNATINTKSPTMDCPVCGKQFTNIHDYATHMKQHSEEQKKREAEEEKQRKADQKKVDTARLEKLRKMYEDAYGEYYKAKEKYYEDYGEVFIEWDDVASTLRDIGSQWRRWF